MGNGHRAEIIDVLAQGERSVEDLACEIGQSVANTSHHLQRLALCGLVQSRRDGTWIFYSLADERVCHLWSSMREVAASHVTEFTPVGDAYFGDRATIAMIKASDLASKITAGRVVVLDVRPAREFAAGHIAGARSVPHDQLIARASELPRSREIIAYCRGPYCRYADDAVRVLISMGYRARRLDEGFPEWRLHGFPVEA